jgi:hypothetical protein
MRWWVDLAGDLFWPGFFVYMRVVLAGSSGFLRSTRPLLAVGCPRWRFLSLFLTANVSAAWQVYWQVNIHSACAILFV